MSKIAEQIIDFLEKEINQKLDTKDFIAGQAVAEAYFRIKNMDIQTRIKDVDLFVNDTKKKRKNSLNIALPSSLEVTTKERRETTSSFFEEMIGKTIITRESKSLIKDTYYEGKINIIEMNFKTTNKKDKFLFQKNVLENFDINAVQIGVCLKSRRVFVTKHFKDFIKTRQVKIVNTERRLKSICRLMKKSEYYKGAYFDIKREINKSISSFIGNNYRENKILESMKGVYFTTDSYTTLSKENRDLLKQYFYINEKELNFLKFTFLREEKEDENPFLCKSFNEKYIQNFTKRLNREENIQNFIEKLNREERNLFIIENGKIMKSGNALKKYSEQKEFYLKEEVELLLQYLKNQKPIDVPESIVKFIKNTKNTKDNEILLMSNKRVDVLYLLPRQRKFNPELKRNIKNIKRSMSRNKSFFSEIMCKNENFIEMMFSTKKADTLANLIKMMEDMDYAIIFKFIFEKNIDINEIQQINKVYLNALIRHDKLFYKALLLSNLNNNKLLLKRVAREIWEIEKGKYSFILGFMETGKIGIDFCLWDKEQQNKAIMKITESNQYTIKKIDKKELFFDNYKINHINGTFKLIVIGQEMKHCVGGYGKILKNKKMLFFDIYDKDGKRYTMSVYIKFKDKIPYLEVEQIKMKMNKIPTMKVMKDLIRFVSNLNEKKDVLNDFLNENHNEK